jgi:hypothetical protein
MTHVKGGDAPDPLAPERDEPTTVHVTTLDDSHPAAWNARLTGRAWRWGLRLGGTTALLGLIAVAVIALSPLLPRHQAPKPAPLDMVALRVPAAERSCLAGVAWAPDGAQVALVRDSVCDTSSLAGPTVMTFNATTGEMVGAFPIDFSFLCASRSCAKERPAAQVALDGVAWSPDSMSVAIPFTVYAATGPATELNLAMFGLAQVAVRGADIGATRSWVESSTASDLLTQPGPVSAIEWDDTDAAYRTLNIAPASAYAWSADGTLTPVTLPTSPGSVSSPAGGVGMSGGAFSMWRSGSDWQINALDCASSEWKLLPRPYVALYLTSLAWSPDGRYLVQVTIATRSDVSQAPAGKPSGCRVEPLPVSAPLAAEHDAGLRAALALVAADVNVSEDVEWRPDGQRLAVVTIPASGNDGAILIYDCRSGKLLRRYTASQIPLNGQPGTGPAKNLETLFTGSAWSPDGRRLLIEASGTGATPFILGPRALG